MTVRVRTIRPVVVAVTAVIGALLLGGCAPTAATRAVSAPNTAPATPVVSPAAEDATTNGTGSTTMVTRVIDGDTFEVTGAVKVRVLGIDSCESGTPGGTRATQAAEAAILGQPVRLTSQSGVDLDRYGRELRYVSYAGGDFAEMMVRADHTAIYSKGRNDASTAVQARLRSLDTNGRSCGTPASSTTSTTRRPVAAGTPKPSPRPRPRPAAAAPAVSAPTSASYANCTAARAAGVTPLHRGQPGYSAKLDRDGDGIACE
jgi:micrococcal nuclease